MYCRRPFATNDESRDNRLALVWLAEGWHHSHQAFPLVAARSPGLTIMTYTAEPGSKSAEAHNLLGRWAATVEQPNLARRAEALDAAREPPVHACGPPSIHGDGLRAKGR